MTLNIQLINNFHKKKMFNIKKEIHKFTVYLTL